MPVDERTLVAWFDAPTQLRRQQRDATDEPTLVHSATVEEWVPDELGRTRRCDLMLKDQFLRWLLGIEFKRPEVMRFDNPQLLRDAWWKAARNGHHFFATSDFETIAVWPTEAGPSPRPQQATLRFALTPGLRDSDHTRLRRTEMLGNWQSFLDRVEPIILAQSAATRRQHPLPPQVADLHAAIVSVSEEAATRIQHAVTNDPQLRQSVMQAFTIQFGVALQLDTNDPGAIATDCLQVARIACFVVATRLLLYQALTAQPIGQRLEELNIDEARSDARLVGNLIRAYLDTAQQVTGDFEIQLRPNLLDDLAFHQGAGERTDVGRRWHELITVVRGADWSGPAEYIPILYEGLLDEAHRHAMGVHYTPEAIAELIVAYAVQGARDVVVDPACGAGTFVSLAYARKRLLGAPHDLALSDVYGVEITEFAASLAALGLSLADPTATASYPRIVHRDFFSVRPGGPTDLVLPGVGPVPAPQGIQAVIGNPPYVRFELRSEEERTVIVQALETAYAAGIQFPNFTGKADLYSFFLAHAYEFLAEEGRLAFVLSWSVLCTVYGEAVLAFLARYFLVDAVIDSMAERFFAASQNTVVILARKAPLTEKLNPNVDPAHLVRFVRLKVSIDRLVPTGVDRGKRAEDLVDEICSSPQGDDDWRFSVTVVPQQELSVRGRRAGATENDDEAADGNGD